MQLEQILYSPRQIPVIGPNQMVYRTKNLESLSVLAFYTGDISISPISVGMSLPGGLKIKDITKNSLVLQEDFGGVGNIYTFHPDGHGSLRFYGPEGEGKRNIDKKSW
jgi:hypothetical protein